MCVCVSVFLCVCACICGCVCLAVDAQCEANRRVNSIAAAGHVFSNLWLQHEFKFSCTDKLKQCPIVSLVVLVAFEKSFCVQMMNVPNSGCGGPKSG